MVESAPRASARGESGTASMSSMLSTSTYIDTSMERVWVAGMDRETYSPWRRCKIHTRRKVRTALHTRRILAGANEQVGAIDGIVARSLPARSARYTRVRIGG